MIYECYSYVRNCDERVPLRGCRSRSTHYCLSRSSISKYGEILQTSIGSIRGVVIVTVTHTERQNKIRLISARKATPKERRQYNDYLRQET
ncbi:MAG: BrnT family toxin [Stigonema ocellatum SAG 48.90 = DSM 106950]|nr:BrnT family toxin [Stigonema ocellatum SAG 48.90 = DSM 106950]